MWSLFLKLAFNLRVLTELEYFQRQFLFSQARNCITTHKSSVKGNRRFCTISVWFSTSLLYIMFIYITRIRPHVLTLIIYNGLRINLNYSRPQQPWNIYNFTSYYYCLVINIMKTDTNLLFIFYLYNLVWINNIYSFVFVVSYSFLIKNTHKN